MQILIRQDRQNQSRTFVAKDFTPGLGENSCRGRIVCAVNDSAFVPTLKTPRPLDGGKAAGNRSLIDLDISGTNGCDCDCGVELLMFATQRDWRFGVGFIDKL